MEERRSSLDWNLQIEEDESTDVEKRIKRGKGKNQWVN